MSKTKKRIVKFPDDENRFIIITKDKTGQEIAFEIDHKGK